ncbi:MAG TPA: beta-ketoacyl synthase N-terminal-like domain-containing protein, partial [Bacteroidia bacterium]|nr:beta-ketoacyl synthase N-terminal-like domain-containing protein [Bacteroidia bacterium]
MKLESHIIADNIISPLGFSSSENFEELKKMHTGVKLLETSELSSEPVCAALIDTQKLNSEFQKLNTKQEYTRLEKMVLLSINDCLKQNSNIDITSKKTLIILSTTKGNIDLLDASLAAKFDKKRVYLWETANVIAQHFNNPNKPIIVSNACISGVLAIILGKRLLETNQYDTIIVSGVDILTQFVVSGFQSFKAISNEVAKPYDVKRDGISLGEGCGTVILTNDKSLAVTQSATESRSSRAESRDEGKASTIIVSGGASSNDA